MYCETKNVKGHFRVTSAPIVLPDHIKPLTTQYSNFWTFRPGTSAPGVGNLVYIVFPDAGYVNVSGLTHFDSGPLAIKFFTDRFNISESEVSDFAVDSSTASGLFDVCPTPGADLPGLFSKIISGEEKLKYPCTISIRPHYFPSALIRPKSALKGTIATYIIFSNGKFVVVGSKSVAQTHRTVKNLLPFFRRQSERLAAKSGKNG